MTKTNKELKKVVISALIGSTIEWYDFFLYGVVAGIVFSKLYFPSHDPYVSILLAYATFAVGFVSRPLGGVIFGHFGDRIGRKSALVSTLIIMGVATFLIGVTPTYDQNRNRCAYNAFDTKNFTGHRFRWRMGRCYFNDL